MPAGGGKTKEDTWKSSELEKQLQDAKGEKVRKSTKTSESADRRDRRRNDEGEGKDRDRGDRERKHRDEDDKEKKHRREVDDREKRHHREDAEKDRKHHREDIEREHRTRREDDERRHQKEDGEREHRTRREDGERRHHKEDGEREHRTRREDGDKSRSSKHDSEAVNDKKSQRRHDDDSNRATNDSEAKKHRSKAEISEKESSTRVRDSDGHRRRSDKEEGEKSKSSKDRPSGSTAEARDDDRRRRRNEDGGSEDRRHKQRDDGQKSRDREEKRRDKNSDRDGRDSEAKPHRSRDGNEESKHRKSEPVKDNDRHKAKVQPPEEDNYEDDFENYEDDFDNDNASDDSYEKKPAKSRGHAFGGSQGNREMDEILRAMSEENNRLLSASEKSHKKKAHVPEPSERTDSSHSAASFIDFGSAKRRNLMGRTAGRLQGRAKDLFDIIELENVSHSLFEHHPTNEYELFIQSFGKSNCTQINRKTAKITDLKRQKSRRKETSVQTNDDTIDRDIQTDDVSLKDKWTQHPAGVDVAAFGGDIGTDASETADSFVDTVTLSKFICKAGRVIALLLEENAMDYIRNDSRSQQSKIIVSEAFTELGPVSVLKDRYCIYSQFSAVQSQLLLAAYSDCTAGNQNRSVWDKGIVCVWNVYESAAPQKILVCHVKPTCCCFSPSKPTLAFAGLVDGSLVVWDLLEVSSQHKQVKDNNTGEEYCLRQPTYNTAGVLHSDNHQSCVISIVPITSSSSESVNTSSTSSVGSAFQLASLDADSVVNLWIVADLGDNDAAGSVSDLGLRPTGQVKLVKSSSILLQNPSRQVHSRFSSFDLRVLPANNNHFFVATDSGCIIHGNRLGGKVSPKSYWPQTEMSIKVTSVDFSPFSEPVFLAGYDDGSLRLYHIDCDQPLMTWLEATNSGNSVKSVHWCRSRPSVFFVLDSNSCIYIWDLNMDQASALKCECITRDSSVTSLCLSNDYSATGQGLPGRPPQMVVFMQNGTAEAHIIKKQFSALMADEVDKFSALIQIMSA